MIEQIMFGFMLQIGLIIPTGEYNDDRKLYELYDANCNLITEYAYKGEILNYIKTKEFKFDEDLQDQELPVDYHLWLIKED